MRKTRTKTRVLLFESYVFKLYGNSKYITKIFENIDTSRYELSLAVPMQGEMTKAVVRAGGQCYVVEPPPVLMLYGGGIAAGGRIHKIGVVRDLIRYNARLYDLLKFIDADVVQVHNIRSLLSVGMAARMMRIPLIWYIKGEMEDERLASLGFSLADKVLFISEALREGQFTRLASRHAEKTEVLPIGIDYMEMSEIDESARRRLREEFNVRSSDVNLVFLGNICRQKGIDDLIRAFGLVAKSQGDVRLFIVGEYRDETNEDYQGDVETLIRREGIADKVVFTGWRKDATSILSLMDILVLPSHTEGIPRSILEAMALGVPVIATRVGGIPDIVDDGLSGYLVDRGDHRHLARRMLELCADEASRYRMVRRGLDDAHGKYDISMNVGGLQHLYDSLSSTM